MKAKKVLALVLCAALLVAGSVAATLAYLKDDASVTNTFTIGNVTITMDEAKVDLYGVADEEADRVLSNEYKLIPSHTYTKDPTITVGNTSEDCYLFVKIENGLGAAATLNIDTTKWLEVQGETGVYRYFEVLSANDKAVVFTQFTFDAQADPADYEDAEIVVTAYAVQADGLNAADAWAAAQ